MSTFFLQRPCEIAVLRNNRSSRLDANRNIGKQETEEQIMASDDIDVIFKSLRLVPEFDDNPQMLTQFINISDQLVIAHFKTTPGNDLNNLALINGILNKVTGPAADLLILVAFRKIGVVFVTP